jgi:hypothetical protein
LTRASMTTSRARATLMGAPCTASTLRMRLGRGLDARALARLAWTNHTSSVGISLKR